MTTKLRPDTFVPCVGIQLIIGLDRYSQRGWHSEGVGTLVAAEIEVGPTTGVSVVT
jgi:hypothetical protein